MTIQFLRRQLSQTIKQYGYKNRLSSSSSYIITNTKRTLSSTTAPLSSSSTTFDKVGIVGLGLMGHGICQVAATSGLHSSVIAYEQEESFLQRGQERINTSLSRLASRGRLTEEQVVQIQNNVTYTTDINDLSSADLIVEAVIEDMNLKKKLYTDLAAVCPPETIFASNTSSLSITEMAEISGRPDKFVGVHFFNPVQAMKLVEVISTKYTNPQIFDAAFQWAQDIGKVAVKCGDTPGFIVNRLLVPYLMQAMLMVDRKDATISDIDTSMTLGTGAPMGPLHLADFIGLDTCYFIVKGWTEEYPDEAAFAIPKVLEEMVQAGHLGRKSGQGFYHWDGDRRGDAASL